MQGGHGQSTAFGLAGTTELWRANRSGGLFFEPHFDCSGDLVLRVESNGLAEAGAGIVLSITIFFALIPFP
jgi:hypothetical protein